MTITQTQSHTFRTTSKKTLPCDHPERRSANLFLDLTASLSGSPKIIIARFVRNKEYISRPYI